MKIFYSITAFFRRFRGGVSVDPVRDWLSLLTVSAIVLISIVVWNFWAFETVSNGGVIGTTTPEAVPIFSSSSLDTIRTIFDNRALEESKYVTGVYSFADPSQ